MELWILGVAFKMELFMPAEERGNTREGCTAYSLHNHRTPSPKISFHQGRDPEGTLRALPAWSEQGEGDEY